MLSSTILDLVNYFGKRRSITESECLNCLKHNREKLLEYYKAKNFNIEGYHFNITPEQAVNINCGSLAARNAFYFNDNNFKLIKKYALRLYLKFHRERENKNELYIYELDDYMQQIYLDLPYYDLSTFNTFRNGIMKTFRYINNGGILFANQYRKEPKRLIYLDAPIDCRNEDSECLIDTLASADATSNPELLCIAKDEKTEERAEAEYMAFVKFLRESLLQGLNRRAKEVMIEAFL